MKNTVLILTLFIGLLFAEAKKDKDTKKFYPSGKIKSEVVYNADKSGTLKLYYPNGNIHTVVSFDKEKLPDGVSKDYSSDKRLLFETHYSKGKVMEGFCYDKKGKKHKLSDKEIGVTLGHPIDCDKKK